MRRWPRRGVRLWTLSKVAWDADAFFTECQKNNEDISETNYTNLIASGLEL